MIGNLKCITAIVVVLSARVAWADAVGVTDTSNADDVEPHPLVGDSPYSVELYWGHRAAADGLDYDIVREPSILVADDTVFADDFDA